MTHQHNSQHNSRQNSQHNPAHILKIVLLGCLGFLYTANALHAETHAQTQPERNVLQTASVLENIPEDWAHANYQLNGKEQQQAFETLIKRVDRLVETHPKSADAWVWNGIVKSSFAGIKGGLGALSYAKKARHALETAMAFDTTAFAGAAYTSLGTLYYKVPGWPIGFGDNKKAAELLEQAVALYPNSIDSNYFYGDFLQNQGDYSKAYAFLKKAAQAAPRPDRPIADAGRHKDIARVLLLVEKKLAK